jgi:hypothetical protein
MRQLPHMALPGFHLLPDCRNLPPHSALVGRREILSAREPIHHIAHQLALADRHAVIVHSPGDGAREGVPIVLRRRARPGQRCRVREPASGSQSR